jgi:hypothetical protein
VFGLAGPGWEIFRTWASERSAVSREGQITQADGKISRTAQPKKEQSRTQDNQKAAAMQPFDEDEVEQLLDMLRKGFQAYQTSKGKQGERPDRGASDLYGEAFHKAFPISNQNQLEHVLGMVRKGFQAYRDVEGKQQAVERAKHEIENALRRMEKTAHDPQAELNALVEIERMIKDRKTMLQREGD